MGWIGNSIEAYRSFTQGLPEQGQIFANLLLLTIAVVIYAVFIWKFYIFISTRDILRLDLNKYNKVKHPVLVKVVAGALYLLEYLIILPLLISFWFAFFTILLMVLSKGLEPNIIVLISAITIASIRVTAYIPKYGEAVSSEIAKLIPLTLLVISLTDPLFFNLGGLLDELVRVPQVLSQVRVYVFFIIFLELTLRVLAFMGSVFTSKPEKIKNKK